ncbi:MULTISPECIES: hypothetical protein [unclassified Aurantimonas]|uniref:hypothetical protein n=1 Tax=unclassified Aurantimonas TaxID=2638230 RepID=UPI002E16F35A|nr:MULTISPECIES: hypothetical protein [unclassified Aurantimonas]MEC5291558.1 hypothetical protein [Aurantimonas sp. C2-3-R2]MEC5412642.1 hypothetical protein [Aurantimonas sp. C2-4-R8]
MTVQITDHALVRYLERVRGVDMEHFRAELAAIAKPFADLNAKHAPLGDAWLVFEGEKLITIVPSKPDYTAKNRNDRGRQNGAHSPRDQMPWQGLKRRRPHK